MVIEGRSRRGKDETEVIIHERSRAGSGKHDMLDSASVWVSGIGEEGKRGFDALMVVETCRLV